VARAGQGCALLPPPPPRHCAAAGTACNTSAVNASPPQEAVRLAHAGDHVGSAAACTLTLRACERSRLKHKDLHAVYSNRAAALLAVGLPAAALRDADAALELLRALPVP
jgi:hypothetical protein